MPGTVGRNIFPKFLWQRWRWSSSRFPPPDPCSAARRAWLSVMHRRNSWVSKRGNRSVAAPEKKKKKKRPSKRTDRLPKRAFIFCLSSWVMRTHASDSVSFTICRIEGGGEEWRRTIVGNNEVLAVNEDYDKKKADSWHESCLSKSIALLLIISFMCKHRLPVWKWVPAPWDCWSCPWGKKPKKR